MRRTGMTRISRWAAEKWLWAAGAAGILITLALPPAVRFYESPCRVEADCRLKTVRMEDILSIEEREKDGMTGLIKAAAWRYGEAGQAADPATGVKRETGTVYVCGNQSIVFPVGVLSGSYEQVLGERDCVVTKELSYDLFGSIDTDGCRLLFNNKIYRVAAVIDKKEKLLMLPAGEGRADMAAFLFGDRERIRERMAALGF